MREVGKHDRAAHGRGEQDPQDDRESPHTLLLGDSFSNSSRRLVPKLFANLTLLNNEAAGSHPQLGAQAMVDSDVVVYEIVERAIASGRGTLIDDRALAAIEAALAANPRR